MARKTVAGLAFAVLWFGVQVVRAGTPASAGTPATAGPPAADALLFYASFDTGLDADVAGGQKTPLRAWGVNRTIGRFGAGAELTPINGTNSSELIYAGRSNILASTGTMALWVKSNRDWPTGYTEGQGEKGYTGSFFRMESDRSKGWDHHGGQIIVYLHGCLLWMMFGPDKGKYQSCMSGRMPFGRAEWVHVAATYTNGTDGMKLYVNGYEAGYNEYPAEAVRPPEGEITRFWVGGQYNGNHACDGIVDEFRVYNRPLTDEEIKALYEYHPEK